MTSRLPHLQAPAPGQRRSVTGHGDLTPQMVETGTWSDDLVARAGIPVVDVPFVTVGGGIGSFVLVDYLRVMGVPADAIRVLSNLDVPWQTYEHLTRVSQIPGPERIRSDSASMPDNLWGFPSYAMREAVAERSLKPVWNVLCEPVLSNYYTPRVSQVFRGLQREHDRIGYADMLVKGTVRMTRRRHGGGYFTIVTPPAGTTATKRVAYRSRFVHLAVGYAGLKFLPDLQRYRADTGDHHRVVNAYEGHEHVYREVAARPCTVVIRGSGIVASRVLQRLIDDRDALGTNVRIVHLFRTYVAGSHGRSVFMRRRGGHGWAHQGFNYPKSAWGGQLKARMRRLEGERRADLYQQIGGTQTPVRRSWMEQLRRGRKEGWYQAISGEAELVRARGTCLSMLLKPLPAEGFTVGRAAVEISCDFVIDCTGLEADIAEHRVIGDLMRYSGAGRNPVNRLDVERTFEVRGTRSGTDGGTAGGGRLYASGAATLGGYFPGVDTFLGLQIAAQEIADDLARQGFCKRLGPVRSIRQWWRWMTARRP
ncbi:hypothetical protein [Kineosporia sp. NBRC 101731]|uniref:hypothetical protein n=1 Tax=Kineosporia sp. NBRC 101731 TaxID=3032199 RepID=UPI002552B7C5|nr:hypothetical protein [Kineosporia sp. NBRC 101731]